MVSDFKKVDVIVAMYASIIRPYAPLACDIYIYHQPARRVLTHNNAFGMPVPRIYVAPSGDNFCITLRQQAPEDRTWHYKTR